SYDEKTVRKRWKKDSNEHMQQLTELLKQTDDFSSANLESVVKEWIQTNELHMGNIMNAFRLAIVGESKGPHMFNITELIGKEETIKRMELALDRLPQSEE
ncbi:MAG: glutamate--tRNA ligase, partial [Bacteroidales bacterium]|nr:glutamate--tRNA ligase [Bacteroidales bacterium]